MKLLKKKFSVIIVGGIITLGSCGIGQVYADDTGTAENPNAQVYSINERYTSGTEDWRLVSSSSKTIKNVYTGVVTKTTTRAVNTGTNIKGMNVGYTYSYSESRQFKTYKRTREITAKFKVYNRMGKFLRYETVTKRMTATHHVPI